MHVHAIYTTRNVVFGVFVVIIILFFVFNFFSFLSFRYFCCEYLFAFFVVTGRVLFVVFTGTTDGDDHRRLLLLACFRANASLDASPVSLPRRKTDAVRSRIKFPRHGGDVFEHNHANNSRDDDECVYDRSFSIPNVAQRVVEHVHRGPRSMRRRHHPRWWWSWSWWWWVLRRRHRTPLILLYASYSLLRSSVDLLSSLLLLSLFCDTLNFVLGFCGTCLFLYLENNNIHFSLVSTHRHTRTRSRATTTTTTTTTPKKAERREWNPSRW